MAVPGWGCPLAVRPVLGDRRPTERAVRSGHGGGSRPVCCCPGRACWPGCDRSPGAGGGPAVVQAEGLVDDEHRQRLERLLELPDGLACRASRNSRRPPDAVNARTMVAALARIEELRGYEVAGLTSLP